MEQINLVKCPICRTEWIDAEESLTCENCEPILETDLAVSNMAKALTTLLKQPISTLGLRFNLLEQINNKLQSLINTLKKSKQKKDEKDELDVH